MQVKLWIGMRSTVKPKVLAGLMKILKRLKTMNPELSKDEKQKAKHYIEYGIKKLLDHKMRGKNNE